jgi:hypothetical protein
MPGKISTFGKKKITKPAIAMKDIVEGRKNEEAYSAFFEHFLPCATKKTLWDRHIAKAVSNSNSKKFQSLCTISDEAFALLLLENSYNQWLDLFLNNRGPVMQRRGVKQRGFQSNVPTSYTRGGIKYDKTDMTQPVKEWSEEGMARFNALFDQVIADRAENPDFERRWLEARKGAQEEEGTTAKSANATQHNCAWSNWIQTMTMTLHQLQLRRR